MAKYSARFALAFSTSVPVCRVRSENVEHIDDISEHRVYNVLPWYLVFDLWPLPPEAPFRGSGKHPAHLIFTDGCGFMNKAGNFDRHCSSAWLLIRV
jgi:RNA dependent RNA polymerase